MAGPHAEGFGEGRDFPAAGLAALQRGLFGGGGRERQAAGRAQRAAAGHPPGGLAGRAPASVRGPRWARGCSLAPEGALEAWGAARERAGAGRPGPAGAGAPGPSPAGPPPQHQAARGRFAGPARAPPPAGGTPGRAALVPAKRAAAGGGAGAPERPRQRGAAGGKWSAGGRAGGALGGTDDPEPCRGFRSAAEGLRGARAPGGEEGPGGPSSSARSAPGTSRGRTPFQLPVRRGADGQPNGRAGPTGRAPPGAGAGAGAGPGGGTAGAEGHPGGFSEQVVALLGDSEGNLPEPIEKLDPQIVGAVCNDVMERPDLQWDEIVGQEEAKRLIQEMVVWPVLNPSLFSGKRTPPKGLLLFGPPGTGKTMLGRAIASNIKATFFNISASSLTSKWIGEGEKLVKALFTVAGCVQPSVVFMDEIDSLLSARKGEGEHEASRRLKTELLVQIEGCSPSSTERRLLIVGATNRPEELDEAARRRMPKQLYIPLPCPSARRAMVRKYIDGSVNHELSDGDVEKVVQHTEGYSGADMKFMLQEALQGPVREAIKGAASEAAVAALKEADLRPVCLKDVKKATRAQKASVQKEEVERYEEYNRKHGASYEAGESEASGDEDDW